MRTENERYFIDSYTAESTEDVYDRGEIGQPVSFWNSADMPVDGNDEGFKTVEEALAAVMKANGFSPDEHWENWIESGIEDEPGRFDANVMVDENNCEPTESDIKSWEAGNKRLFSCRVIAIVKVRTVREIDADDIFRA